MPNPLSRVRPNAHWLIGPDQITFHQPKLSLLVLCVINAWAATEAQIGNLMAAILGQHSAPVIDEMIKSKSSTKQREILAEHARSKLNEYEMELLSALLLMAGSAHRRRNPFAHWLSGCSLDLPDAVLYTNPTDWWRWQAALEEWTQVARTGGPTPPRPKLPTDKIMVYVLQDFRNILDEINDLAKAGQHLSFYLRRSFSHEVRADIHSQLLGVPRFQQALEKTREDRQKAP